MAASATPESPVSAAPPQSPTDGIDADWDALMRTSLAGDQAAYGRLLRELQRWLANYLRRRLPPATVDDAVQDTLIAVHEKRHTWQPEQPLRPWVAAIARYKWIDRLRAMRHDAEPLDEQWPDRDSREPLHAAMVLERLLAQLKPAQAQVIGLVKLHGLSIAEASRRTGQSESLVKVNIHRGLAALARAAEQTGDES